MRVNLEKNIDKLISGVDVRYFDPSTDYFIAQKWWMQHNVVYLERHLLPDLGVVAVYKNEPIAMVWIYLTNSKLSQIAWLVTKPELPPKLKMTAILMVMNIAQGIIKDSGYKAVQIVSDRSAFTKVGEILGFNKMKPHDFLVKSIIEDNLNDV